MSLNALVIAGASAVGKTVVASRVMELDGRFSLIRSATTRAPRGDGHDSEYLYYSREDFLLAVENGEMLEYMEYAGELYGTPRTELVRVSDNGFTPLLILDLKGVMSLYDAQGISPMSVYIWDDINRIEERLYERYLTPPTAKGLVSFVSRKEHNLEDFLGIPEYEKCFYAFIKNDKEIDDCASSVLSLYSAFALGVARSSEECKATAAEISKMAQAKL